MSRPLTDGEEAWATTIVTTIRTVLYAVLGYALSRHMHWIEAVAATFVFVEVLRAVRRPATAVIK